jgi:tRNA threonylcarbamoyladenosine biosynthesis protein TsaE
MEVLLEIEKYELNELGSVAEKLAGVLPESGVLAFHGEMGVGKTTLVNELCRVFGVEDEVSSPTFGLINVYKAGERTINHVDLFRVKNAEEAETAGVFELFYSEALTIVEWPERIADELPEELMLLKIELCENFNHDSSRRLVLSRT